MARELGHAFALNMEDIGMTMDVEAEILTKGMKRCIEQWHKEDPDQSNFSVSSTYGAFAADLAMLFGVSEISDGSITVILSQNEIQMDPISRENLLEKVQLAQDIFIDRNKREYDNSYGPWPTNGDRTESLNQK